MRQLIAGNWKMNGVIRSLDEIRAVRVLPESERQPPDDDHRAGVEHHRGGRPAVEAHDLGGERQEHDEGEQFEVDREKPTVDRAQPQRHVMVRQPEAGDHGKANHEAEEDAALLTEEVTQLLIEVRTGEVRHLWEHSIAALERTRWSITFRSLSERGRTTTALGGGEFEARL